MLLFNEGIKSKLLDSVGRINTIDRTSADISCGDMLFHFRLTYSVQEQGVI